MISGSRIARSPRAAWSITLIVVALSAAAMSAGLWKWRTRTEPVERTLAHLTAIDPALREKMCAHRCNDVARYRVANLIFHCIEIDVVLEPPSGGPAAVYHPPASNDRGLTLDHLLAGEPLPRGRLWLDVKDLSGDNWLPFLAELAALVPPERRGDVIVETSWSDASVAQAAAAFRGDRFLFSYYVPTEEAIDCGSGESPNCEVLRRDVSRTASMGFSHVSFDARAYPFVESIRDRLPSSVRLLTWQTTRAWPRDELLREADAYVVGLPGSFDP